ncbi:glycoside hydrolase family 36 protein [Microbacterium marmarense]|uniref:Glycoside hydrolase family 36 protein n=1 Tax=Microbacterium marmarense TaxID=3122051 RepID=A0ABU8LQW8_9MICO
MTRASLTPALVAGRTAEMFEVTMQPLIWTTDTLSLMFEWDEATAVRLTNIGAAGESPLSSPARDPLQVLVEILTPMWGRIDNTDRFEGTRIGADLRYSEHQTSVEAGTYRLAITQQHADTGLLVTSTFEATAGVPAVRTSTTLTMMHGHEPLVVWAVTTLATGALISNNTNEIDVYQSQSAWTMENRWKVARLRSETLTSIDPTARGETCKNAVTTTSLGAWSSGTFNPVGVFSNRRTGQTMAWQIEHNGAWHWEVGEKPDWPRGMVPIEQRLLDVSPAGRRPGDRSNDGGYVSILGPTDALHHWSTSIDAEHPFTTVPASFTVAQGVEDALGNLAWHRRSHRRGHTQNSSLPVIYNDYMNTLSGDPTEQKLLPLIDAASEVGADYFCIDAGWYDDTAGWWASVGDWFASTTRFPSGLDYVMDRIRARGMKAGLWLEPEVVGAHSVAARELPDEAFLQRQGVRIREHDRYFLDLRHPETTIHLDRAVDRLIADYGVEFFKFDYNVTPGPGTDLNDVAAGAGLLEHNRALTKWLNALLDRHPDLIIENCGSGGLRSDFAMLEVLQMQSTSDQQDPLIYPAIAVGALGHILPEQAANWAYPQPDMDDEMIVFTMCTGLAGRLYLSGVLNRMDEHQRELVARGVQAHQRSRASIARSTVRYPTGLRWQDQGWISVAFDAGDETYLIVWRQSHAPETVRLDLPHLPVSGADLEQVYPPIHSTPTWDATWDGVSLLLTSDVGASARMYRLLHRA